MTLLFLVSKGRGKGGDSIEDIFTTTDSVRIAALSSTLLFSFKIVIPNEAVPELAKVRHNEESSPLT
jgi:hypothetical protein